MVNIGEEEADLVPVTELTLGSDRSNANGCIMAHHQGAGGIAYCSSRRNELGPSYIGLLALQQNAAGDDYYQTAHTMKVRRKIHDACFSTDGSLLLELTTQGAHRLKNRTAEKGWWHDLRLTCRDFMTGKALWSTDLAQSICYARPKILEVSDEGVRILYQTSLAMQLATIDLTEPTASSVNNEGWFSRFKR